jgi:hypothetical protein
MKFEIMQWLSALPSLLRPHHPTAFELRGRSLSELTETEMAHFFDQCNAKHSEDRSAQMKQAHAAAASGEGPHHFDEDWIENGWDVEESIEEAISNWSWGQVQDLGTILDWAMASPQAQRALAERSEECGVRLWRNHLEMVHDMRLALSGRSYRLLSDQAEALGWSEEATDSLLEAQEENLNALRAEYREFVGPA